MVAHCFTSPTHTYSIIYNTMFYFKTNGYIGLMGYKKNGNKTVLM